jgi:hypothetical protein
MLEQLAVILPEVAAYETGLLDFLLRGELAVSGADTLAISSKGLGAGTLEVFVEDSRGVRSKLSTVQVAANTERLAQFAAPTVGVRVVAVFRGTDAAGEPLVAIGSQTLTR